MPTVLSVRLFMLFKLLVGIYSAVPAVGGGVVPLLLVESLNVPAVPFQMLTLLLGYYKSIHIIPAADTEIGQK